MSGAVTPPRPHNSPSPPPGVERVGEAGDSRDGAVTACPPHPSTLRGGHPLPPMGGEGFFVIAPENNG
jgi:hypothetical protein